MIKRPLFLITILLFVSNISIANKLDSLLKVLSQSKVDTTLINCWNELSSEYAENDTLLAKNYAAKSLQLARKINYTRGIVNSNYALAYITEVNYQYPLAEKYYLIGIEEARRAHDLSLEAQGLHIYAIVLGAQTKHEKALEIKKRVLSIYQKLNDSVSLSKAYNNLGNSYNNTNQFMKAIECFLAALKIEQLLNNNKGIARAYNNIGITYERMGDHESALKNFFLMYEPAKKTGSKEFLAHYYGNIGGCYQNLSRYKEAKENKEKSLALNRELEDLKGISMDLNGLGLVYNELKLYTKAIEASIESIEIAQKTSDVESEGFAYLNLARAYRSLENKQAAKPNILRAESLIESVNSTEYIMEVYLELTNYFNYTGDYKNSYKYFHLYSTIKDSIYNAEKHLQISSLQTQYQTAEKEKALSESNADNLKKSLLLQKKNNLLIVAFGGLLLIAFLSILIWRNAHLRKVKLIQEKELSEAKAKHQLQEEKLRISRELHDNIGAQLTFINSSLQHLSTSNDEEMEQTKTMTLNTIRELRSIVWLINKEEFYVEELVIKLRDLMKPLQNKKPRIEIVSKGNEDIKLKAQIASNVFRIIQEATNNTIKYAQANVLSILVDSTNQALLKLRIHDDGIGFDVQSVQYSFGLKNMESRVKDMNGKIDLKTSIGSGTELNIEIPLA